MLEASEMILKILDEVSHKMANLVVGVEDNTYDDGRENPSIYTVSSVYANKDIQSKVMKYMLEIDEEGNGK